LRDSTSERVSASMEASLELEVGEVMGGGCGVGLLQVVPDASFADFVGMMEDLDDSLDMRMSD